VSRGRDQKSEARSRKSEVKRRESSAGKSAIDNRQSKKTRYIMIGGFLGAGKTTSVARLASA